MASDDAHVFCKLNQAPSTIPAHAAFLSIRIEVFHPEIKPLDGFQQHEPISPNAKFPVAQEFNLLLRYGVVCTIPVVQDHKIISRSLILVK